MALKSYGLMNNYIQLREPFIIRFMTQKKYMWMRYLLLLGVLSLVSANETRCRYDSHMLPTSVQIGLFLNQLFFKLSAFTLATKLYVPKYFLRGKYTNFSVLLFVTITLSIKLQWLMEWLICCAADYPDFRGYAPFSSLALDVVIQNTQWILFVSGLMALYMFRFFLAENDKERQMNDEKMRLETELLKRQVSPKLLLASLHKLGTEGVQNPSESSDTIISLCHILRYRLYDSRRPMALLESEITFMRKYLNMLCYAGSCRTANVRVEGSTLGIFVPSLLFLPLFSTDEGDTLPEDIDVSIKCGGGVELTANVSPQPITLKCIGERLEAMCHGRYTICQASDSITIKLL